MTAPCPRGSSSHVSSCPVKGDKDKRSAIQLLHINIIHTVYDDAVYNREGEEERESLKPT